MLRRLILFPTWLCLLSGCAVGPDFRPPPAPLEDSYGPLAARAASQPYAAITSPADTARWWAVLQDPVLDSLVEKAAAANHDVRLAAARVREARAREAAAGAAQFPDLNVSGLYSHTRVSQNAWPYNAFGGGGFPLEADLYQAGFDASWELDVFGGVRRSVEAAGADVRASVQERRAVLVSVLAEVARNYVELRSLQLQTQIAQSNLQAQRETLELTAEQARRGVARQLEVSRASAQVSTTEAALPRLRNLQWQAMHRLAVLTGQTPGALVETLSRPAPVPLPPARTALGVPADLLRRRPDLRRAEEELAAATARIGVAMADLYPRFSLTGSFNLQSSEPEQFFKWGSRAFGFGPAVRWPLFDAGALRAVVQVRNAQQEQSLVRYEQTVLRAMEEVRDALSTFVTEQDRRRSLESAVKSNEESAELSRALYKQGLADFTSVLDAERQLYLSQEELVRSQALVSTSLIALYKALGGGWEMESATDTGPTSRPAAGPAGMPSSAPASRPAPPLPASSPAPSPAISPGPGRQGP